MPHSLIPPRDWPQVYLDEDVRAEVRRVIDSWAVRVMFARDVIGTGLSDDDVVAFASGARSILVTSNAGHFLSLAKRGKTKGLFLLVLLYCSQSHAARRLAEIRDVLECEILRRAKSGSHGTMIEIHGSFVRIYR